MDKTIETTFFKAFEYRGVVNNCIECMRYKYNLPSIRPTKGHKQPKDKRLERLYSEIMPKQILEATSTFDDSVIYGNDSPLITEIEANLNECPTSTQRDRYLFSLLKPFGMGPCGCGIARIYTPIAEINTLKAEIDGYEKEKAFWQTNSKDSQAKEQIDACTYFINDRKEQADWIQHVNNRFIALTSDCKEGAMCMQKGTVECCLKAFVGVMRVFANRLDALLLIYGIDLLALQNKSGIYLKRNRLITNVQDYIGSRELAQYYIDKLPIQEHQQETSLNTEPQQKELKDLLPKELRADEAVKVFLNAMDAQLITLSPNGLMWNDSKQLLAYFATRMSDKFNLSTTLDKDGNKTTAWKPFETLFNVQDLKGAKQNWMRLNTKFEPNGFEKVDALF